MLPPSWMIGLPNAVRVMPRVTIRSSAFSAEPMALSMSNTLEGAPPCKGPFSAATAPVSAEQTSDWVEATREVFWV